MAMNDKDRLSRIVREIEEGRAFLESSAYVDQMAETYGSASSADAYSDELDRWRRLALHVLAIAREATP